MAGGERRHADDVNVLLDRQAGRFLRCLEEGTNLDREAQVGEG